MTTLVLGCVRGCRTRMDWEDSQGTILFPAALFLQILKMPGAP